LHDWERAPAPAHIGKRIFEGLFQRRLGTEYVRATNNVMHWLYGGFWGALYGVVVGSTCGVPIRAALGFGPLVWASGYAILVPAKLYKPMWEYDAKTNWEDLSAHIVYGVTTAATFAALS
jgi:uncharacterized membrane protein YagU involved in acid resistance